MKVGYAAVSSNSSTDHLKRIQQLLTRIEDRVEKIEARLAEIETRLK